MKCLKKILFLLLFVSIILITNNVKAEIINYGYYTCHYKCTLIDSTADSDDICFDRWKPENNTCKGDDGKLLDNAEPYYKALNIDYNGSQVNMLTTTDLFEKGANNYENNVDAVKKAGITADKNVFVYKVKGHSNEQNDAIWLTTYYIHDFRPLIEYYEIMGKYPTNVVADLTGESKVNYSVASTDYFKYTYYPSEFKTVQGGYEWSDGFVTQWKDGGHIHEVDFMEDYYGNDKPYSTKLKCRNEEYYEKIKIGGGYNCSPATSGKATIRYYFSSDMSNNASFDGCEDLDAMLEATKKAYKDGGHNSTEYQALNKDMRSLCKIYMNNLVIHNTNSKCSYLCSKGIAEELGKIDDKYSKLTNHCGFGEDMVAWLMRILKIMRYIVPIIVIVTSTMEYISAIGAAEDDAMKKAGNRFSKRLLIMIVFFILPSILQFLFNIFNIPGLDSSDPYCMKF